MPNLAKIIKLGHVSEASDKTSGKIRRKGGGGGGGGGWGVVARALAIQLCTDA